MEENGAGLPPTYAPPAYAAVQPRTSLRLLVIGGLVLLAVGAGAGGWALTEYQAWRADGRADGRRDGATGQQLAVSRTAAGQAAVDMERRTPLAQNALAAAPGSVLALPDRVAALEARLAQLSLAADSQSGNAARAEALLIAFAARRALDRGLALGTLESQLRLRFGDAQPNAVASVIAAAQAPVTLDRLQSEFDRLTPQLIGQNGNSAGLWAQFRRGVGELFVVRPANAPSTRTDQRLARAQRLLDAGLIDQAAREIRALPGASAATAWLDEAAHYHEARRALDLIETAAILAPRDAAQTGTVPSRVIVVPASPRP